MSRRSLLLVSLLLGCSSASPSPSPAATDGGTSPEDVVFGGERPVAVFKAPTGADPKSPLPLVRVLHGYGAGGLIQTLYFGLDRLVDEKKFLLVAPDGTTDSTGSRFWAATDTCCDVDHRGVDDVKYLTGLVEEIASVWTVDRKRIYLVGHSNGGAMAYRLACDASKTFAAITVLAPPFFGDSSKCAPTEPVAVRHLHGTADTVVPYDGGPWSLGGTEIPGGLPGAKAVAAEWAAWNGCGATPDESAPPVDLDRGVPGAETTITRYGGCRANGDVELWTMAGSTHIPADMTPDLANQIWGFLEGHAKP